MTLTIDLTLEEEVRLHQKAARQGQAPESIVRALVRDGLTDESAENPPTANQTIHSRATHVKDAGMSQEWPVVSEEAEAAFVQSLLAQGVIDSIPAGRPGPPPRPIVVRGQPVSETIIEERR